MRYELIHMQIPKLARRLLLFKAPDSNRDNYQAMLLIDRGNYIDEMEIHHLCATLPGIGARRNLGGGNSSCPFFICEHNV